MAEDSNEEKKYDHLTIFFIVGSWVGFTGGIASFIFGIYPNASALFRYGTGASIASLAVLGLALFSYLKSKKWRYHVVDEDKGGDALISHIKAAKRCILATHFTLEPPSDGYLGILKDRLKNGVRIHRVIHFQKQPNDPAYAWLAKFSEHPDYYTQTAVSCSLPFNMVIIDGKFVWLFLPSSQHGYFRDALWIENERLAALFTCVFDGVAMRNKVS
jgi:hypothetical protein